jgi:hypothetical protein
MVTDINEKYRRIEELAGKPTVSPAMLYGIYLELEEILGTVILYKLGILRLENSTRVNSDLQEIISRPERLEQAREKVGEEFVKRIDDLVEESAQETGETIKPLVRDVPQPVLANLRYQLNGILANFDGIWELYNRLTKGKAKEFYARVKANVEMTARAVSEEMLRQEGKPPVYA